MDLNKNENYKYVLNEKVNIYEDESHEFKHILIKDNESLLMFIYVISKYICAYLNSNSGCIYIGISDDGIIKGINLNEIYREKTENELTILINQFKSYSSEEVIDYKFHNIINNTKRAIMKDYYIIEIFIKKGKENFIYTTPYIDSISNNYECYIKLNGTIHKINGSQLQRYVKNKIKKYYIKNKIIYISLYEILQSHLLT